ncbi:MAG: glycosyltransferase family 39 protein, partial [Anaerolineae bacterium]
MRRFALAVAVLAVAALLRFAALDRVPPGLQHDEVFGAVFAEMVFAGQRPIFLDMNGGNEPLFLYAVTVAMAAFGRNVIALRFPAVAAGMVGICATYWLTRQLLGQKQALLAAALMSLSLWHVLDSRVSLRAIWLPAIATLAAGFLWRWLRQRQRRWWALGALFLGLTLYTYTSSVLVPLAVLLFALLLLGRGERRGGAGLALAVAATAVLGLPLFLHMAAVPEANVRLRDLGYELAQLRAGNPWPVLANGAKVAGMFAFVGDPEWRYNVAGRPVFTLGVGLAFYLGVAVALARWRRREYAFLLIWLVLNLGASVASGSAPSSLRAVGAMPAVFALAALGLWWPIEQARALGRAAPLVAGLVAAALLWEAGDSLLRYFVTWPANAEVREVYRADLAAAARYLGQTDGSGEVLVSSEFAADLDRQSFQYLGFTNAQPRWFDAAAALLVPQGGATVILPRLRPAAEPLLPVLVELGHLEATTADLDVWSLAPVAADLQGGLADVATDWSAQALRIESASLPESVESGDVMTVLVRWRVTAQTPGGRNLTFFAHLRDDAGRLWSQADVLVYPTSDWRVGDQVYQLLEIAVPADMPPGRASVQLGLYEDPARPLSLALLAEGLTFWRLEAGDVSVTAGAPAATATIEPELPLDVAVGGGTRLIGAAVQPRILQPGGTVDVSLWWQGAAGTATPVALSLERDGAGTVPLGEAAALAFPAGGETRTLRQRTTLTVPRDVERGQWRLVATLDDGRSVDLGEVFAAGIERIYQAPAAAIAIDAAFAE